MNLKPFTNICLLTTLMLFSGCGSSKSNNETTEDNNNNVIQNNPILKNEPYAKYAWHLVSENSILNSMNYIINPSADINVTKAWEITKGEGVKVAVIDNAFDVEHEDLKENILATYNADNDTTNVTNTRPIGSTDDEGYPHDGSHGNTCAGFIVAPVNGKGSVGIAPESKLIAIKLESQFDDDTIKAFEYAKNQGAKVINCSWGSKNVSDAIVAELKSLYDANITVLFASGNESENLDEAGVNDESEVQWVIGVGASGENNDVTTYSNYGKDIDILAPGGDSQDSIGLLGIDDTGARGNQNQKNLLTDGYAFTDGTSFATPIAAGVVALMYAANPNITPAEVRTILINNSDKIGVNNATYINDFDEKRAYGKINAGKVINEAKKLIK